MSVYSGGRTKQPQCLQTEAQLYYYFQLFTNANVSSKNDVLYYQIKEVKNG